MLTLTKKDLAQIKRWIQVLYSGEYHQTQGRLQDLTGHCCLGVGCDLFIPNSKRRFHIGDDNVLAGYVPGDQKSAPEWLQQINEDVGRLIGKSLSNLNDDVVRYSFEEIGMLIQLIYVEGAFNE